MKYFELLKLEHIFILLVLLIFTIIFGTYYRVWIKSNKLIFSILVFSVFMIGGNDLPIWWETGAKHYDFIYNLGFSILSGFFFYWLTVLRGEMKKREYYSFYSLNFLLNYYNLISHFYLRELFNETRKEKKSEWNERKTAIKFTRIKVDIPYVKIFTIIEKREQIVKEILKEYYNLDKKLEKDRLEILSERFDIINEIYEGEEKEEAIKNAKKNVAEVSSKESIFIYKIYRKICEQRKKFEEELSYYSSLGDFEEIDTIRWILNYSKENLNGDVNQMEYFIKNYKYIEPKLLPLIKRNIEILKTGKRFIPSITLFLTPSNFGILDEEIFCLLIMYFYKEESKFYFDFETEKKRKILEVIKKNKEYYFILENEEINVSTLRLEQISLEKNNEVIIS
ncbi:MAG: hypothetical protein ACRCZO_09795 [Cetobacterium sp.]